MLAMFSKLRLPARVRDILMYANYNSEELSDPSVIRLRPIFERAYIYGMVVAMLLRKNPNLHYDAFTHIAEFYDFAPEYYQMYSRMRIREIETAVFADVGCITNDDCLYNNTYGKYSHVGSFTLGRPIDIARFDDPGLPLPEKVTDEYIITLFYDLSYWTRIMSDEWRTYDRYNKQISLEKQNKVMSEKCVAQYAMPTPPMPTRDKIYVRSNPTYKTIIADVDE